MLKIAVFQADWALQVHTVQLVEVLAAQGNSVDVFLLRTENEQITSVAALRALPGVRVTVCEQGSRNTAATSTHPESSCAFSRRLIRRVFRFAGEVCDLLQFYTGYRVPTAVISDIEAASACVNNEARQYDVAIGVEGAGLIWAGFATSGKCGLIYYSLELFLDQHPCYHARRFKAFKRLEHYWHRRALATVVQDPRRAHWLLNSASIQPENHKVIYWPVSVKPCARDDIVPLREKLGIPPFKKTLIYVGNVERRRNIVELCEIAKSFPSDWLLVVHGRWMGDAAYHHQLSQYLNVQQIRFSRDLVPADGLGALIRGCDAGLALYDDVDINHRLTGFASEKVATYFSEAIPIIAYDYPSFTDVCARWKCGVQIACLGRLPDAFRQIISEQIEFREGARAAFRECYDFSAASSEFLEYLKSEDFRTIG